MHEIIDHLRNGDKFREGFRFTVLYNNCQLHSFGTLGEAEAFVKQRRKQLNITD
jgi:hypothetical protein